MPWQKPEEHKKGPPCIHTGWALIEALAAQEKVAEETKEDLKKWMKGTQGLQPPLMAQEIRHCKLGKAWKKDTINIIYHFTLDIDTLVLKAFLDIGADVKTGRAPPGALENAVQKHLEEREKVD